MRADILPNNWPVIFKKVVAHECKKKKENRRKYNRVVKGDFNKMTFRCDPGPEKRQFVKLQ